MVAIQLFCQAMDLCLGLGEGLSKILSKVYMQKGSSQIQLHIQEKEQDR